ncbi:MAG: hypothetical protein M3R59_05960 [Verrucomicrobiota bacterium]|nr:hypothetical protein [Verrucomicrobiota bacterium]
MIRSHARWLKRATLVAILAAPSLWMFFAIPPLWKDIDAYLQVTAPPQAGPFILYGPVTCLVPRAFFYLGQIYECMKTGAALPSLDFFAHPTLSDPGVWLLLGAQHLGLVAGALFLITSAARKFLARLLVALLWAVNPLFYVWAHCVGSEALSLIIVLFMSAVGLRIVRGERRWFLFGALLVLAMLTRHINGVLAALLPIAFGAAAFANFFAARQRVHRVRRWLCFRARKNFQRAALAVAVGLACIAISSITFRGLSYAAGVPYQSSFGFTFLFRLNFLASLSISERAALLERVQQRTNSPGVKLLLDRFATAPAQGDKLDVMALLADAQREFAARPASAKADFRAVLNENARAFLLPPTPEHLHAMRVDFQRAFTVSIYSALYQAFGATTYLFPDGKRDLLCARLTTFRNFSAAHLLSLPKQYRYLRRRSFTYARLILLWCVLLIASAIRRRRLTIAGIYAIALTAVGLLAMLATNMVDELQARFTLPMWELTICSAVILIGHLLERKRKLHRARTAG